MGGSLEAIAAVRGTLRELFSRRSLSVVVRDASDDDETVVSTPSPNAVARAFIDLRSQEVPRIVVVDGRTARELERRTLPSSPSLEMAVEAVTHVLYVAVESSLSARETPPPPSRPAPPRPTTNRERGTWQLDASAFGRVGAFGDGRVLEGVGASLDAGPRLGAFRPAILGSFGASLPGALSRNGSEASLVVNAGRVLGVIEWRATGALVAFAGAGGGVDGVHVTTGPVPAGSWKRRSVWKYDPILGGAVGVKVRLSPAVAALLGGGLDVDLSPHRYMIESSHDERLAFFDLARVRPVAFVGLSFSFPEVPGRAAEQRGEP